MIRNLTDLLQRLKQHTRRTVAVAAAEEVHLLKALQEAVNVVGITPLLIGNEDEIRLIAQSIGFDLSHIAIVDNREGGARSARLAVGKVKSGEADFIMKGFVSTSDFLKEVLDKGSGLRTDKMMSHVTFFQSPYYHKILCVTDVAMNISPDLEAKVQIIQNAVEACHHIGIENPKVAIAAAVEQVNPRMEATVHAAMLKEMNRNGQLKGCIVDGPFAIDIAVNRKAALHKGIEGVVAGDCDIILAPDIEAGNMFYKALNFLGGAVSAALVMGASVPVVLTSRSDDEHSKLLSVALAAYMG
jgi:phosphate butyryltransferase